MAALVEAAEYLARQPEARYDYSPLIKIALATGLRLGELLGLTWADVDLHAGELHVRRQWTRLWDYGPLNTRAAVGRLPLSEDIVTYLASTSSRRDSPRTPTRSSRRSPVDRSAIATSPSAASSQRGSAGLRRRSFHSMRHAFASRMIARGISATVLARLMGHETSVITERRYVHLFDKQRTHDAVRQAMAWGITKMSTGTHDRLATPRRQPDERPRQAP